MLTRQQAEKLSEEEAKKIALAVIQHKDVNSYIIKDLNASGEEINCLHYYQGKRLKYITYPAYVYNIKTVEEYIERVKSALSYKVLWGDELLQDIDDYFDYKKKLDFLWNIFPQYFDYISDFKGEDLPPDEKEYKYHALFKRFKNENVAKTLIAMYNKLTCDYEKKQQEDDQFLRQQFRYELGNHEFIITHDYEPTLDACGFTLKQFKEDSRLQRIMEEARRQYIRDCSRCN